MSKKAEKIPAAMRWLQTHMQRGQVYNAGEILAEAQRAGHKERTLQLASELLGIEKGEIYGKGRGKGTRHWQRVLPDEGDDPARLEAPLQLVTT